jgi:hypothetical protein
LARTLGAPFFAPNVTHQIHDSSCIGGLFLCIVRVMNNTPEATPSNHSHTPFAVANPAARTIPAG